MGTGLPLLYSFRRCPYAMRARLALAVSGTVCELREVVLRNKPAELQQASAKATVPVLLLPGGEVLEQSLDIMRWALGQHDPFDWLVQQAGSIDEMHALIAVCDNEFKHHLDRYKYPNRHGNADPLPHRTQAARWLTQLNQRLGEPAESNALLGRRPCLADMAIAPFVRQYAHTDQAWFDAQDWAALQSWLARFEVSPLFERIMQKYPPWQSGSTAVLFPAPA